MQRAIQNKFVVKRMNTKGSPCWCIYLGDDLIDLFTDESSAQKEAKRLNDLYNKPKLDNTLPNKNAKTTFTFF